MNKKYLISYDLDKPGQQYHPLIEALKEQGAKRVLYSEWILVSTSSAVEVCNYFRQFVDGNDMLLVVALTGETAWTSLMITDDSFKQTIAA